MNTKIVNPMRNMCRTCMKMFCEAETENSTNKKQSIKEAPAGCNRNVTIIQLLQLVQPDIKVDIKDNLPMSMCTDCIKKLLVSHEFIEMYQNANKTFRKMLNDAVNSNVLHETEMIEEKNFNDKVLDLEKLEDIAVITKNEYEIQEIHYEKLKDVEENEKTVSNFDDKVKEEAEDIDFKNAFSNSSDSEWIPDESCQRKTCKNRTKQKERRLISNKITVDVKELIQLPEQNEDGTVPCQECEAVLGNVKLWQEHMRQHRLGNIPQTKLKKKPRKPRKNVLNKKFVCEHCGKGFESAISCKSHRRIHKDVETHLCIECGKSFRGKGSLKVHMLRHKGEKNYQCSHCPKKFVCSSGLYNHEMIHTSDKPFECHICGKRFHKAYQLNNHDLLHKGIKKYQCEYCDMRFITREKQLRHMRTHTGEKPYCCKYCERAFAQSNDYIKHLRKHLGDNVYQCELCPVRFPLVRDLRVHFATHKDDDDETRARNLEAKLEDQRNLQIKLGVKETSQSSH